MRRRQLLQIGPLQPHRQPDPGFGPLPIRRGDGQAFRIRQGIVGVQHGSAPATHQEAAITPATAQGDPLGKGPAQQPGRHGLLRSGDALSFRGAIPARSRQHLPLQFDLEFLQLPPLGGASGGQAIGRLASSGPQPVEAAQQITARIAGIERVALAEQHGQLTAKVEAAARLGPQQQVG